MRNLKKKTLWLIILVLFLIVIGLIIGCAYSTDKANIAFLILILIDFIAITYFIQIVAFKTAEVRLKRKYPKKIYECNNDLYERLKELKFEERKTSYGFSFLLVKNKNAYKVALVYDNEAYNTQQPDDDNQKPNKELDKCNSFLGLEIFYNLDEKTLTKISDYSLQGNKIYYTALGKNDDVTYTCYNYLEPNVTFKEGFNMLFNELGLTEKIEGDIKNGKHN